MIISQSRISYRLLSQRLAILILIGLIAFSGLSFAQNAQNDSQYGDQQQYPNQQPGNRVQERINRSMSVWRVLD